MSPRLIIKHLQKCRRCAGAAPGSGRRWGGRRRPGSRSPAGCWPARRRLRSGSPANPHGTRGARHIESWLSRTMARIMTATSCPRWQPVSQTETSKNRYYLQYSVCTARLAASAATNMTGSEKVQREPAPLRRRSAPSPCPGPCTRSRRSRVLRRDTAAISGQCRQCCVVLSCDAWRILGLQIIKCSLLTNLCGFGPGDKTGVSTQK